MAEMWYYTNEGKQMDPVSIKELKRLVGDGVLKPTDMVWKEGMARWIRASSVKELFPDPASALDHYFSQSGKTQGQPLSASIGAPAASTASAPAPSASKAGGNDRPEPQPQKKPRRSSDDNDDDERPSRRGRQAAGGGSMVGVMIALVLGGGVLLLALVVGVIILIVVNQGPAPPPGPGPGNLPMAADPKEVKPLGPINANTLVKAANATVYQVQLNSNEKQVRDFSFRQGAEYEILVNTQQKFDGADVDVRVFGNGPELLALDIGPAPDCNVRFTPAHDGQYRVELHNCLNQGARAMITNSTVSIREIKPPPEPPKDPPLPPGVFEGKGGTDLDGLVPGKSVDIKLRVKRNQKAKVQLTTSPFGRFKITVLKENEDTVIVESPEKSNPSVEIPARPALEIVRVRVTLLGAIGKKTPPTSCGVQYDTGG